MPKKQTVKRLYLSQACVLSLAGVAATVFALNNWSTANLALRAFLAGVVTLFFALALGFTPQLPRHVRQVAATIATAGAVLAYLSLFYQSH